MKTPWRIADWNIGKIMISFAAICFVVFVVVGLFGLKRGVENRNASIQSETIYIENLTTPGKAEMAAWIAETKEPVVYSDTASQLIQQNLDLLSTTRLTAKTIKMYKEIVAVLESDNAALKKRISEYEACLRDLVPGDIVYRNVTQVPGPYYGGEPIYWQTNYITSTP